MGCREMVGHFEIDRILDLEGGNPRGNFHPIAGGVHHPKIAFASHPVC